MISSTRNEIRTSAPHSSRLSPRSPTETMSRGLDAAQIGSLRPARSSLQLLRRLWVELLGHIEEEDPELIPRFFERRRRRRVEQARDQLGGKRLDEQVTSRYGQACATELSSSGNCSPRPRSNGSPTRWRAPTSAGTRSDPVRPSLGAPRQQA